MKRKNRKRVKRVLIQGAILLAAFLVMVAVIYVLLHRESKPKAELTNWTEATLPVITAQVEGEYMNAMYGYVDQMADRYMRDTITPLNKDGQLKIRIMEKGENVSGIRYEIRSLDTTQLVEATTISEWKEKEQEDGSKTIKITLPIQNLLSENEEYQLKILLTTDGHETVSYYTRIVKSESLLTDSMLSFVKSFQKKTINTESASGLATYLKENTDTSNSLGFVTLHSSYKQLLWNYLNPKVVGDINIRLTDINASIGTFVMNYRVSFKDDFGKHVCNVEEVYTVQFANNTKYMLVYERSVNEILKVGNIEPTKDRIRLGIVEDDTVRVLNSEKGQYRLLNYNGEIWLNHVDKQEALSMTKLFTMHYDNSDIRSTHEEYKVNLVSVDDEGNADFYVYGYNNRGSHEGKVGLTFYRYEGSTQKLQEIFFLPFDRSFYVLEQEVGQLAYLNQQNLFYIMLNNTVYAIDFSGKEYVTVVDNVSEDAFWISEDMSLIAWGADVDKYGAKTIHIYNLEDGKHNTVKAKSTNALQGIGFIDRELAMGVVKRSQYDTYGTKVNYVMNTVKILSSDGSVLATYKKKNVIITDASIEHGSVLMKRSRITNKQLKQISDDALIENTNQETIEDELLTRTKPTEGYVVWYMIESMREAPESFLSVDGVWTNSGSDLTISLSTGLDSQYFAFAKGRLQAICSTVADAVAHVYDDIGYVTDSNGYYVMRRGYRSASYLTIASQKRGSSASKKKEACMTAFSEYEGGNYAESFKSMKEKGLSDLEMLQRGVDQTVYDLTGCKLSEVGYYFLSYGHPLYALTSNGPVLITGMTGDTVYMWSPMDGKVTGVTIEKAERMLARKGDVLFSCMGR